MTSKDLIDKYLAFFQKKDHKIIPSASLVPENDPTVLFTTAGMHPLVPYLLGEPHPEGKRLVSLQKCLRTDDIDSVGDTFHHTFFLMLGNWSLGDYFKKEAISWSLEFLTKDLLVPIEKISVTVFAGDKDAARDNESAQIWQSLGIPKERIFYLSKKDNWWGPAGKTGPCGPDTEMFYDTGKSKCGASCQPGCPCGKYFEIWNDVFMEFNKKADGSFEPLKQKNVDTGMGVERIIAVLKGVYDDYKTEFFNALREEVISQLKGKLNEVKEKRIRIFLDHSRAAVFISAAGILPGNKEKEYILRRLIRRADDQLTILKIKNEDLWRTAIKFHCQNPAYDFEELNDFQRIKKVILEEVAKYNRKVVNLVKTFITKEISGKEAFNLYSTYGFSKEQLKEKGYVFDEKEFEEEFKKHQELSRKSVEAKFAGGLADHSEETTKLHTATHLLNQALREVLGSIVVQKGSNITAERLRFDFNYPKKLSVEDIKKVEDLVNQKIQENLVVTMKMMTVDEAIKRGAQAQFKQKYGEKVKVYSINNYSLEICGGPHVDFTGRLGKFKIIKEESAGSGIRRIYGVLKD